MHETATLIIAVIGALIVWTSSVVAMVSWLASKFRNVEKQIYREGDKIMYRVGRQAVRIQRLEAKTFGVTYTGDVESDDGPPD